MGICGNGFLCLSVWAYAGMGLCLSVWAYAGMGFLCLSVWAYAGMGLCLSVWVYVGMGLCLTGGMAVCLYECMSEWVCV